MEAPRELKPILDPQEVDPQFRPSSSILRLLSDTSLSRERSHRSQASRRKRLGDLASASHSCSRAGRRHGLRHRRPGQSILVFTALSLAIIRNSSIPPVLPLASAQPTIAPTSNTTSNSTLPTSSPVAPSNVTDAPVASSNVTVVPDSATPSTAAPVSAAPSTLAPVTAAPTTPPPTAPPVVITWPTVPPTPSPTISPTSSKEPSNAPSIPPTNYPTVSSRPTNPPSLSTAPSYPPSTSSPTVSPNKAPTLSPVVPPTASPSTNVTLSIVRECNQILEVSAPVEFVDVEVGIYQLQMQSYTANFGEMVGIPFVVTTCTVTEQNLAGGRRVVQREGSSRHGPKGDDSARDRRLGRKSEQFGALGEGVRKTTQNEEKRSHLQLAKWLRHNPGTDLQTDILEHMFPSLPSSRTLQTTTPRTLLVMQFNIQYESRYGVVIDNYPSLFQEYINSNLEQVTLDMQTKFLPVVSAREVIVYNTKQPTLAPTPGGSGRSILPTPVVPLPTPQGGSPFPTISPSGSPIDFNATAAPSASPTLSPFNVIPTPPPTPPKEIIEDNTSFVVGLAAGLSGAALLVILFICYKRRENRRKQEAIAIGLANNEEMRRRQAFDAPRIMEEDGVEITAEEAMIVGQAEENENAASESYGDGSHRHSSDGAINNSGNGSTDLAQSTQQQEPNGQHHQQGTIADSIYSNPSMVSGGGSFSSKEGDNYAEGDVLLDPLQDEFDNYKNQDLEFMRNGVEESVYGAEGMMSWAMTRALMEDDDEGIDLKWGGAQDPESIEANCLCETYDWLRKNDHSTLDERNQYFQDILSRMIVTVRKNMIKPNEGTRTIHCCASLLGLRLEKDLPNNVLIVTGMRKTNNLSEGRYYLMEAFKPFGTIEGAAIAPSNRGFGFVRFAHHKSVERALQSFRVSEIEVQDVSVMIKALKSESPGV